LLPSLSGDGRKLADAISGDRLASERTVKTRRPPTGPAGISAHGCEHGVELGGSEQPEAAPCERCGRVVERGSLWALAMSVPPGGPVEPEICLACPAERRRQLLAAPGGPDARGPPPEAADAAAEAEAPPTATLDWFLVQGLGCVGVGVGVFIITFADVAVGLCSER
jgi:hypothetical protein